MSGSHLQELNAGPSPLLRARDAAKYLAISARKLWELTNRGEIPAVRIGRSVRYDPADLRAWIESRKGKGVRDG
jgi:excisionase family DNA binding protein